ncbi:LysE family translocator [Undibacterium terreum]|uniref:Amino acid transporter n=1 Tax=Undibacterium terreum TaxID=1224302 RepID=A0A916XQ11_9BURK|nr:LysE family translocator [Undibacterium terreum]GGC94618.1 amino acid transporter [Undibacterium terreum]
MLVSTLLLFFVSSVALAVTPGPTMLLALSNGISSGTRVAAYGIAGATLASACLIAAVAVGLGSLLLASETLFNLLRVLGVIYLCWLAYKLWRSEPAAIETGNMDKDTPHTSPKKAFLRCATVSLSNPKAILFFSAFLPQFVDAGQPLALQYFILGAVFLSIDAMVMLAYAMAGKRAARLLSAAGLKMINRGCAVVMAMLALALATFRRA